MRIDIKVILRNGERVTRHLRTPPHTRITEHGTDMLWKQEADRLQQFFPGREFRLVPLRDGNFNFVEIPPELAADQAI
jgi:hypothetical protein